MKLGCVVQRYGTDVAGGAELHCRLVAEHLAATHAVEVFTTCARDYVTWRNAYPSGTDVVNGVTVHRFPVARTRNIRVFEDIQNLVFHEPQTENLENRWLRENGPDCPRLVNAVRRRNDVDAWILFSYRYWTTAESLRAVGPRAVLVPTAEHDPALYLRVVRHLFRLPGAIAYNSVEEQLLIQSVSDNHAVPGDIVGVGLEGPEPNGSDDPGTGGDDGQATGEADTAADQRFRNMGPYVLYIGRIDKNKGCDHLFRMFQRYCRDMGNDAALVTIGHSVMPMPDHPRIVHLGFVSEAEKAVALRHCRMLVMPSQYESLSMVVLEAWRHRRPVLVNGRCEVLDGQCRRSNGGLAYRSYDEFAGALSVLLSNPVMAERMGNLGNDYYRCHYLWPVITQKYDRLLARVVSDPGRRAGIESTGETGAGGRRMNGMV